MRRSAAVITSAAWFVVTGGVGAVLVPWWLTGWRLRHPLPYWSVVEAVGILLIVAGLIPAVHVFVQFVRAGGTPMPGAMTGHLVVTGFNRHVRNPDGHDGSGGFGAEDVDGGSAGTDPHRQRGQRGDASIPGSARASSEEADGSAVDRGGDERLREHASAAMAGRSSGMSGWWC